MSNNLSPTTRALLDAAKHDGPSREKRAAMWTGITGGLVTHTPHQFEPGAKPQGATSPGATGSGAAAKGAFWAGASMKGAFIGALFGSAISIGVATFMLRAKTEPAAPPRAPAAEQIAVPSPNGNTGATANAAQNAQASGGATSIELPATNETSAQSTGNSAGSSASQNTTRAAEDSSRSAGASKPTSHPAHATKKDPATSSETPDDMLSREVALVSQARRELLTGDAAAALKSVRAARSLEARQLEPEEMSLEARALRQLGRDSEAERVESQLRAMYPGR